MERTLPHPLLFALLPFLGILMRMEPKKVLSIEDDAFLSSLVSSKLVESGLAVVTASFGADGLAKVKSERPDLVLLDIMLPDIGGFEILQTIKADPDTRNIPVIILSNLGGREEIEKGVQLGAASYLIKSNILPHEVAEIVQSQIANAAAQAVASAAPSA
jgi:CheY-like chemotaxis protein